MKALFLATALMMGGAAIAQDTTMPPAAPATGAMPATPAAPADAAMPPADASTAMPPATTATDPSASGAMSSSTGMSATPSAGSDNYPVCSKTVTDRCVQKGAAMKMRKHK